MTTQYDAALASALSKMDEQTLAKCKRQNQLMPINAKGFRVFAAILAALTPPEADAVYMIELLGDDGTAATREEAETYEKENYTAGSFDDFIKQGKIDFEHEPITTIEACGLLWQEVQMPVKYSRYICQEIGVTDELTAEQQKVRVALQNERKEAA